MRPSLKIEGLGEMDATLGRIGSAVVDRASVTPVLIDALRPVAEAAQRIVPVRSGRLRADIGVSDEADGADAVGDAVAYVGPSTDAFYAVDVEQGRPASISRTGREHDATRPHPFMRPAWDAEQADLISRVGEGLHRLIADEAQG